MENPDHDEMDEPYEDIVAAQAMLQSAAELLRGHQVADKIESINNQLNRERLELLGNGQKRPFWVSELKLT
jgi:ferric iron reductase protein FhuF